MKRIICKLLDHLIFIYWNQDFVLNPVTFLGEYGESIEIVIDTDPLHPVDSFNLLKRTSLHWPTLQEEIQDHIAKEIIRKKIFLKIAFQKNYLFHKLLLTPKHMVNTCLENFKNNLLFVQNFLHTQTNF